jgi:hypothetical protein
MEEAGDVGLKAAIPQLNGKVFAVVTVEGTSA